MTYLAHSTAAALFLSLNVAFGNPSAAAATTQSAGTPDAPRTSDVQKIPGAVRDAGTYHLATGTWTRNGGAVANFGPDTVYANTFLSGYFTSVGGAGGFAPGGRVIDHGMIPTSLNTDFPAANRDSYNVNCVSIGYCDLNTAGSGGWELTFYNNYEPCTFDPNPTATVSATMLPANGCWNLSLDLTGGSEFCLAGDGGDLSGASPTNFFGWGRRYIGTGGGTDPAGFFLAGHPGATVPAGSLGGEGTYYGPPSACSVGGATGLGAEDRFWVEDPALPGSSGCFFFGGYVNTTSCIGPIVPFASFFLELQADTSICGTSPGPFEYCQSNPNSTGATSTMTITGSASLAADDVVLTASVPPIVFGYFLTSPTQGFSSPATSNGNVCISGNIGRFTAPGQIKNSGANGEIALSTALGEWSLTAVPAATGPFAAAVGMETNFQLWHRDVVAGASTSNLTNGYSVTWIN